MASLTCDLVNSHISGLFSIAFCHRFQLSELELFLFLYAREASNVIVGWFSPGSEKYIHVNKQENFKLNSVCHPNND